LDNIIEIIAQDKMLTTTTPHLHTRRPSPTTVEYTVSTTPPLTLSLRLLLVLTWLVRLILGLSTLLFYSKYALSSHFYPPPSYPSPPSFFTNDMVWYTISQVHTSSLVVMFTHLASQTPVALLVPASLLIFYVIILRVHTTESLLVLRGLGIQTSTSATTYLGSASTRFIPTVRIQDVFVNEAFRGFEVRYYLVVMVEGEEEVVVVFPKLLPKRAIVEKVWRGARDCLYEPEKGLEHRQPDMG
jgi:phosphatidylinositol glycan class H protein